MIFGPFSEEFFWYDEESDPELLNSWDDPLSTQSNDDWAWDEWGDLVAFLPICFEPAYRYPLILWLSLDEVAGVTLRDWFPDLSERNYLGAEVRLSLSLSPAQNADRVAIAIREIAALYRIHPDRIWVAGVGACADGAIEMRSVLSSLIAGVIAIGPTGLTSQLLHSTQLACGQALYVATDQQETRETVVGFASEWSLCDDQYRLSSWDSLEASRMAICRDLNVWLMEQICVPAGRDSRD